MKSPDVYLKSESDLGLVLPIPQELQLQPTPVQSSERLYYRSVGINSNLKETAVAFHEMCPFKRTRLLIFLISLLSTNPTKRSNPTMN